MTKFVEPNLPALFTEQADKLRQFDKSLIGELANWTLTLKSILDGGISIDDNVDARRVSVVSHGTPGTEFNVAHTLGKIPLGYIVTGQDGPGTLYDGATATDKVTLYLKSDAATTTFRLLVF